MTRRKMFLRMITASLLRRRSRMLVALLSIGIGATILSGLVTIYYDVPRQMGAQFRNYGANMILVSSDGGKMSSESAKAALSIIPEEKILGATPYRYVNAQMTLNQRSFVTAGTDFTQVQATSPYFSVEGSYPVKERQVLIGKQVAETIGAKENSVIELSWKPAENVQEGDVELKGGMTLAGSAEGFNNGMVYVTLSLGEDLSIATLTVNADSQTPDIGQKCAETAFTNRFTGKKIPLTLGEDVDALTGATFTSTAVVEAINKAAPVENAETAAAGNKLSLQVAGILDTGGDEEQYIFMSMSDMEVLTGEKDTYDVMELSVSASAEELDSYVEQITAAGTGVTPRLVKRVTKSEASVLTKLQSLVFLVTVVVLVLTMICVSTTMTAVVTERRKEIGLRKALGASDNGIRVEFLGEGLFLGGLGGLLGAGLGFAFAQVVSVNVFGGSITFQPLLLPVTMIVSMAISALSCMIPIRHAVQIDPALVLKGE